MLLAVLEAIDSRAGQRVIERVLDAWGKPSGESGERGGWLGSWESPAGVRMESEQCWAAEGWLDLASPEVSPASIEQARGSFALLALRDAGILLASGRAGGYRPLFLAQPSPQLVIACTRLSVLLHVLPQRPSLDLDYLAAATLSYRGGPADRTPYSGIKRLAIGEAWLVRPGKEVRRWSTFRPLMAPTLRDDDELPNRLRGAVTDATRKATRGATRVGVEISGGLDSSFLWSILVSLARAGELSQKPEAIRYECAAPAWHDDGPYLRSLEAHLGQSARCVKPSDAARFICSSMVVDAMPAPSPILSTASVVGKVAREHGVQVLLTGDGGDDVLDGDPRLFADLARWGSLGAALSGALRTRGVFHHGRAGRLSRFLLRPLLSSFLPASVRRARQRRRRDVPRWAGSRLKSYLGVRGQASDSPASLGDSPGERYSKLLGMNRFGYVPLIHFQEEVVGGYALRAPLLDDDFLRFAATLPQLSLMRGGYLRGLMREAMRGLVPEDLRLRVTKGNLHWFVEQAVDEAGGFRMFEDLSDVRMLADLKLVEPRHFRKVLDDCLARSDDADYAALWSVLSVEAFLRQYAGDDAKRAA